MELCGVCLDNCPRFKRCVCVDVEALERAGKVCRSSLHWKCGPRGAGQTLYSLAALTRVACSAGSAGSSLPRLAQRSVCVCVCPSVWPFVLERYCMSTCVRTCVCVCVRARMCMPEPIFSRLCVHLCVCALYSTVCLKETTWVRECVCVCVRVHVCVWTHVW